MIFIEVNENCKYKPSCKLNIEGNYNIWELICSKCKGTKEELELINKSTSWENNDVIERYDFDEDQLTELNELFWFDNE